MDLEPDPVARPVDEPLAVARVVDDRPRGPVDVLGLDARADRLERGLLRLLDDGVDLLEPLRGLADERPSA